ncbi:hypothetical protein O7627_11600 [Solwaraspora sp. WMMD1047]|uniref:hypothetical protein n=1 Tax=Solwaraspora sp. WMMD1047 TaxID=3016102 RepID=UPI002415CC4B|nr:hypothetical protein [Solwaraspora sp. WMMD1047]MDG4829944.1 hypothetical protein [Solwaraspora sp. WMMD1047]
MAHTPMPKPRISTPGDRLQPVPVGLLLPSIGVSRTPGSAVPDWHGLSPRHLAYLIRRYTDVGDVVLDLEAHPTAISAATYLHRVPARLVAGGRGLRVRLLSSEPVRRNRSVARRPGRGVGLILVTLPRTGQRLDTAGAASAMSRWRSLLRPGGFLLVRLISGQVQADGGGDRASVIAAARAAGLFYHQHIPAVLVPLPEHETRTSPEHSGKADDGRGLLTGRHLPTVQHLLAFGTTATGEENTCV